MTNEELIKRLAKLESVSNTLIKSNKTIERQIDVLRRENQNLKTKLTQLEYKLKHNS